MTLWVTTAFMSLPIKLIGRVRLYFSFFCMLVKSSSVSLHAYLICWKGVRRIVEETVTDFQAIVTYLMKKIEPVHSTWLCSSPIPSTLMRIVSPGLRCRGGLKPDPTPVQINIRCECHLHITVSSNPPSFRPQPNNCSSYYSCVFQGRTSLTSIMYWYSSTVKFSHVKTLTSRCACGQNVPSLKSNTSRYCCYHLCDWEYH